VPVIQAIGWLAALCSATIALPQGIRLLRNGSAAGVSLLIWQTTLVASLAWTSHGLIVGLVQIALPNSILAITCIAVLSQLQKMRSLSVGRVWFLPAVCAVAAGVADFAFGSVAFAAIVLVPTALGLISQWKEIVKATDVLGVSVPGIVLNLACQSLWLVYAIPTGEIAVTVVVVPVMMLTLGSLFTLLGRRRESATAVPKMLTMARAGS